MHLFPLIAITILYVARLAPIADASRRSRHYNNEMDSVFVAYSMKYFERNFIQAISNMTDNYIVSPISIWLILAMTAYGAQENTRTQLIQVLRFPNDYERLKSPFQTLVDNFSKLQSVELHLASKIFVSSTLQLNPHFKDVATTVFRSEIESLDFNNSTYSSKTINHWCAAQTENRIKNIVDSEDFNEDTSLVLVNALYFKGAWNIPFSSEKPRIFYVNGITKQFVPTMSSKGYYKYGELDNLDATYVLLPYKGLTNDVGMFIILPNKKNGLKNLERNINSINIRILDKNSYLENVRIYLPKFTIESQIDLQGPLTDMGLSDLFSSNANLSGIVNSTTPLRVSKIVQKSFIKIDMFGTEAAASSALQISARMMPIIFKADHPFIIMIATMDHPSILFAGRYTGPASSPLA